MEQDTSSPDSKTIDWGRIVNHTGQRYGKLVAIAPAGRKIAEGRSRFFWLCQCDCGETVEVQSTFLRTGRMRSCGCLFVSQRSPGRNPVLPAGGYARNQLCRQYKRNAAARGLSWGLGDDDFSRLTSQPCFYCGLQPSLVMKSGNSRYTYSGIDRKDNTAGYTPENAVSCCKTCNLAKRAMPYEEFMAWIARIAEYQWFRPEMTPTSRLAHANQSA